MEKNTHRFKTPSSYIYFLLPKNCKETEKPRNHCIILQVTQGLVPILQGSKEPNRPLDFEEEIEVKDAMTLIFFTIFCSPHFGKKKEKLKKIKKNK